MPLTQPLLKICIFSAWAVPSKKPLMIRCSANTSPCIVPLSLTTRVLSTCNLPSTKPST
ncbi:Uncharacterised protein [Vibrio cholerae]|nr:Uncharacterised protein [Vibrio cholerae]